MMDYSGLAIGGVVLLPTIVALIQFLKSLSFLTGVPGDGWRLTAFLLGIAGQIVVLMLSQPVTLPGWGLSEWSTAVVWGVTFGLAAGKSYDEASKRGWLGIS